MADQSIASTAAPGYVTLPDGRVMPTLDTWFNQQANNPQGLGAAEQRTALSQGYTKHVAQPLTNVLGDFIGGDMATIAEKTGLLAPETATSVRDATRGVAGVVVPQDLTQLGIDAGMLVGGALPKGFQVAGRVFGSAVGGGLGGAMDYQDTAKGALSGAGRGMVQGGVAESIGAIGDYARKMGTDRATRKIQEIDAAQFAKAMKSNPRLQGVFNGVPDTSDGLHDLVKGYVANPKSPDGLARNTADHLIGQKLDAYDTVIEGMLSQQKQRYGRDYLFPKLTEVGKTTTWKEARQELTDLGRIAGRAKPGTTYRFGERDLSGEQVKQLYAEGLRAFQKELGYVDGLHGTQMLKAFNEAREMEAAAQYYLKALDVAFAKKTEGRRAFNTDRVMDFLDKKRKSQVEGVNRLGEQQFWELAGAVRLDPKRIGQVDVYQPHGLMSQAAGILPGPAGAYMRFHIGAPRLVNNPLGMLPESRTGLALGVNQAMSPLGQMGQETLMQPQGIPGLR